MPSKEDKAYYSALIKLLNKHNLGETVTRAHELSRYMLHIGADLDGSEPGAILSDALMISIRAQHERLIERQRTTDGSPEPDPDDTPFDTEEDS
jgi:hypothetical protein